MKQPRELTIDEIQKIVNQFKEAARRAVQAGFDTIELHGAHGYLIHQFMSPSSNKRTDEYGENLAKFGIEVIQAVKSVMPQEMPLIMRVSAIEYVDDGYGIDHCIDLAKQFKEVGVDMFHVSSGGEGVPGKLKPGTHAGYQVPFARKFKEALNMPVIAVGNLNDPQVAEEALANGDADLVAVGRGMLNDPYWALHAIKAVSGSVTTTKAICSRYSLIQSSNARKTSNLDGAWHFLVFYSPDEEAAEAEIVAVVAAIIAACCA